MARGTSKTIAVGERRHSLPHATRIGAVRAALRITPAQDQNELDPERGIRS